MQTPPPCTGRPGTQRVPLSLPPVAARAVPRRVHIRKVLQQLLVLHLLQTSDAQHELDLSTSPRLRTPLAHGGRAACGRGRSAPIQPTVSNPPGPDPNPKAPVKSVVGGGGGGMTPRCDDLVCSWRRLLADRHSLPFPWTLSLHRRWCPSASHHL